MIGKELNRSLVWGRGTCESCLMTTPVVKVVVEGRKGIDYRSADFVAEIYGVTLCCLCISELREHKTGIQRCPDKPTKEPGTETIQKTLELIKERGGGEPPIEWPTHTPTKEAT